jgi:DNA-binding response OmpR family regulator
MATILVIDDDSLIRSVLRQVLESEGHVVVELPDGARAAAVSAEIGADLAIVDLIMPEQEGLATILALRGLILSPKIIAMSGGGRYLGSDFLTVASVIGAHRTVAKPFDRDTIVNLVNEVLQLPPADG